MTNLITAYLLLVSTFTLYQEKKTAASFRYNTDVPDLVSNLPMLLSEISGITYLSQDLIAANQDEIGSIFIYNITKNVIIEEKNFATAGDYEGIAKAGNTYYILKSNGTIYELNDKKPYYLNTKTYITRIPAPDNEGLFYDKANSRLLVGCKGRVGEGDKYKHLRAIYAFDLKTKTLVQKPVYEFNAKEIREFYDASRKNKDKEENIDFSLSDLAIHPLENRLYVLSSADNLLYIFEISGKIIHIEKLSKKLFPQPEGITFDEKGNMFISNEGKNGKATILKFNYLK